MLKRLIHSARVNVFESAHFYYWVLWMLIGYSITREIIQKITFVYFTKPIVFPREIVGALFFVFAFCSIISTWVLRKKIDKKILFFITSVILISLFNELRFSLGAKHYNLMESLSRGQLYYVFKIIFPLLFVSFWPILDLDKKKSTELIKIIEKLFIANAALIIFGGIFANFSVFESYPLTGRWGYCGLFFDRVITQLIYGLLLIYNWNPKTPFDWKSLIYIICLFVSGQKAGFLWVTLFLFIVVFKKVIYRAALFFIGVLVLGSFPVIINKISSFSPFWNNVLHEYGAWGVLFSTRNNTIVDLLETSYFNISWIDLIFGGISRYPLIIEMLALDIFVYFGALGLIVSTWFIVKWIPSWKWGIPFFVALVTGGIIGNPLMTILYYIISNGNKD